MKMITINGNNAPMSLQQYLNHLCRHQMVKVNQSYLIMYKPKGETEYIPHGIFQSRVIAEFFEHKLNHDYSDTIIIPVDDYQVPLKV